LFNSLNLIPVISLHHIESLVLAVSHLSEWVRVLSFCTIFPYFLRSHLKVKKPTLVEHYFHHTSESYDFITLVYIKLAFKVVFLSISTRIVLLVIGLYREGVKILLTT
jgi:hypothetical protein